MEKMDKSENNCNESTEEPAASTYCKDVTPILRKNAVDQSIISKVTEELKIERLRMEHAEIDVKIAAIQQRIAQDEKEGVELDRQLLNATEMEKQSVRCLKRTENMFTVLVEETEKLKNEYKNLVDQQLKFTTKVEDLVAKDKKIREKQQEIQNMKQQINEISSAPKPSLDEDLVQENLRLRLKYQNQVQDMANKRLKKSQMAALKEIKCKLLQEICMAQTRNGELRKTVTAKKQLSEKNQRMLEARVTQIQDKIASTAATRNALLDDIRDSQARSNDIISKIISKKSQSLPRIEEKKIELAQALSSKQSALANEQLKQAEQPEKFKSLSEKLETESREVEELHAKKQSMDTQLEFLKKQLADLSASFETQLAKANADFREKKDFLTNQHSLEAQKIELLEIQRNEMLNKVRDTKKELRRDQIFSEFQHMQYQVAQNNAAKLGIDTATPIHSDKLVPEIQENIKAEELEVIEMEDAQTSGRKSPGILKSPGTVAPPKTPKHVSFEGLSSTESSASGIATIDEKAINSDLNEDCFDKLMNEWSTAMPNVSKRKNFDF